MNVLDRSQPFLIDGWLIEPDSGKISRDGQEVHLEPRVMDVLVFMAGKPGEVVSREEIESTVWEGMVVGYDALSNAMIKLRKALNDDARNPRVIQTVAKRGYKLIADIEVPVEQENDVLQTEPRLRFRKYSSSTYLALGFLVVLSVVTYMFTGESEDDAQIFHEIKKGTPTIIVLPFDILSNDPEQAYFSDGITDDLITDLSKLSGLSVIARRTAFTYKGIEVDVKSLGKKLNVKYVLEGSVRKAGDKIRVNARLTDSESGLQVWAERYDRKMKDIFVVQDDVRKKIVSTMSVKLTEEEHLRMARRYTENLEAYDLFLKGRALVGESDKDSNRTAREFLNKAIVLDPGFARAYAALALSHVNDLRFLWTTDEKYSIEQAVSMAQRALEIDSNSVQAQWVFGYVSLFIELDPDKAIRVIKRAMKLDPNDTDSMAMLAVSEMYVGNYDLSEKIIKKAMLLNQSYPSQYASVLGMSYLFAGDNDRAYTYISDALQRNTGRIQSNIYMIVCNVRMGNLDDAHWQAELLKSIAPDFSLEVWKTHQPFKDKRLLDAVIVDLKKVGL